MVYNLSVIDNQTNPLNVILAANTLSDGIVGLFIIFILWVILFAVMKLSGAETKSALVATSFIILIIAAIMWSLTFISFAMVIYPLVVFIGSLAYFFWGG